jgi:hypothetical protein
MAYCPPEVLDDRAPLFTTPRTWAGIVERKPGFFHVRAQHRPGLAMLALAAERARAALCFGGRLAGHSVRLLAIEPDPRTRREATR